MEVSTNFWVAREKNGYLSACLANADYPVLTDEGTWSYPKHNYFELDHEMLPEITFEKSPVLVTITSDIE
jgi:hypothetical protein